jgi:hypothetical protein
MTKQPQRLDDDDAFDERGVLRDGKRWTVPMSFMDSMQRSVAQHFAKVTMQDHRLDLHDGHGGLVGFRPGWAVPTDNQLFDSNKRELYRQYDEAAEQAYKDPPTGQGSHGFAGAQVGDICTVRNAEYPSDQGSPGHLKMVNGALVCTPDQPRSTSARPMQRNDAQDIGTLQATHDAIMREEYSRFDQALEWRHVR